MTPINVVSDLRHQKYFLYTSKSKYLAIYFHGGFKQLWAHHEVPLQIFPGRNINLWSTPLSVVTHADGWDLGKSHLPLQRWCLAEKTNCRALVSPPRGAVTSVSEQVAFESRLHPGWRQQQTAGPTCPWCRGQPDLASEVTAATNPERLFFYPQQRCCTGNTQLCITLAVCSHSSYQILFCVCIVRW